MGWAAGSGLTSPSRPIYLCVCPPVCLSFFYSIHPQWLRASTLLTVSEVFPLTFKKLRRHHHQPTEMVVNGDVIQGPQCWLRKLS